MFRSEETAHRFSMGQIVARGVGLLSLLTLGLASATTGALVGAPSASASATAPCSDPGTGTVTCGAGTGTWTVPAGVSSATFDVLGAQGSDGGASDPTKGGKGGEVVATIVVTAGETLTIRGGGSGDAASNAGFNGGAAGGSGPDGGGGRGGGASDVARASTVLLVAGGGGGAGGAGDGGGSGGPGGHADGNGGDPFGGRSCPGKPGGGGATGGALGAGGSGPNCDFPGSAGSVGTAGQGGSGGGASTDSTGGGGGGGGALGGGGGGGGGFNSCGGARGCANGAGGGGGGGGSSAAPDPTATNVTYTDGTRSGDGTVTITYPLPASMTTQTSSSVPLGGSISDTATLAHGVSPTGSIKFKLYGPNDTSCAGPVVATSSATVNGAGNYTSAPFTPTAPGTYRWVAKYSGDTNNPAIAGACGDPNEDVFVGNQTGEGDTLSTKATPAKAPVNAPVTDTAVLRGLVPNRGGSLTFVLYGAGDTHCKGIPAFTSTVAVNGNGQYQSAPFNPTTAGTYQWVASYTGDGHNRALSSQCTEAAERVVVSG